MKFSLVTVLLLLVTACSCLFAQEIGNKPPFNIPKQYSVDCITTTVLKPDLKINSRFFVDGNKMRGEMNTKQGRTGVLIRGDEQKMYTLLLDQKKYIPLAYNASANPTANMFPLGTWTRLADEAINGITTLNYKLESNATGTPTTCYYWINPATGYPLRMYMEANRVTLDFANFKAGPPPAALFEIPNNFTEGDLSEIPSNR